MPGTSEPHITVSNVAIGFGGSVLLERLDFEVMRGEIFVILGGSGCGKSTLMRHMIGFDEPMAADPSTAAAPARQRRAGYGVCSRPALFGSMTLGENVALPLETWTDLSRADVAEVVRSKLRLVGLGGFEHHCPRSSPAA
jgi:phospholipid/cholesterol/gamma-HCH transport system ATP-binding protein